MEKAPQQPFEKPQGARLREIQWIAALFPLLLMAASTIDVGKKVYNHSLTINVYHAANLAVNYFQFGAVRRGLVGTILYCFAIGLAYSYAVIYVVAVLTIVTIAYWMIGRTKLSLPSRVSFAIVLTDLMLYWKDEFGRTDIVVASLLVLFSAFWIYWSRPFLACFCISVALAVHEVGFIFGVPLLVTFLFGAPNQSALTAKTKLVSIAILAIALVVFGLIGWLPHSSAKTVSSIVRSELPKAQRVDLALYYALSGLRGVRTSVCTNLSNPNLALQGLSVGVILMLCTISLAGRNISIWVSALIASVPPVFLLFIVAIDVARWTALGILNIWLVCITQSEHRSRKSDDLKWARLSCAVLVFVLHSPRAAYVEFPVFSASPLLEHFSIMFGGPKTPTVEQALERCDPSWLDVVN